MGWWLRMPDGVRLSISGGGVLIGRAPDCDVIVADLRVSRRHALVFLSGRQPQVVALGTGPTDVGGTPISTDCDLDAGQTISVADKIMTVEYTDSPRPPPDGEWVLQQMGGGIYGVSVSPFTVGGGQDNLHFDGWPERALTFWNTGGRISVEAGTADVSIEGAPLNGGYIVGCHSGTQIDVAGVRLQVLMFDGPMASTAADTGPTPDSLPRRVRLAFLPRGARLYIVDRTAERAVYLPERRAELVSLLLSPPKPYVAGDWVPDEELLHRLWPRQTKTTNDLHVLVHRVRKSLVAAELDGPTLICRDPQAGGTRFTLGPGAQVQLD